MTSTVRVVPSRDLDVDLLTGALGFPPLDVAHVEAPSIRVAGRFHHAACRWLERRHNLRPVTETSLAHARRLGRWIEFLRTERGHVDPNQLNSDVFAATEEDLVA